MGEGGQAHRDGSAAERTEPLRPRLAGCGGPDGRVFHAPFHLAAEAVELGP